jgi:hypothetical protein
MMRRCSARLRSSPARMITVFVASPICAASVRSHGRQHGWGTYLGFLCLRGENEELGGGMYDLDLADDRRGVRGDEEFAEVVDK